MKDFAEKAAEYFFRVEQHIFGGNDIRADIWMDRDEKQEAIKQLDRARTNAHNELIRSYCQNFDYSGISNRTQLADRVAVMVLTGLGKTVDVVVTEGAVRDELAEMLHKREITTDDIVRVLSEV